MSADAVSGSGETSWNFADLWEACAQVAPDRTALVQGARRISWRDFDRRSDALAGHLLAAGLGHQDKVAQYLTNCPEYMETTFACAKAGLVPCNTNYRYSDDELVYVWDNADAAAVVFHGCFTSTVDRIRERCPAVRAWVWVDDGTEPCPSWAGDHTEVVAAGHVGTVRGPWGRSGRDALFLYTGGTTGHPKATMWEQDSLVHLLLDTPLTALPRDIDEHRALVAAADVVPCSLPVSPMMHGTGQFTSYQQLSRGGMVAMVTSRSMDPVEVLEVIGRERVTLLVMVGDAMYRPLVTALDDAPGHYDLSTLEVALSSGAMWSQPVKQALARHKSDLLLYDSLGSSEAPSMATSLSNASASLDTAHFTLVPHGVVIGDDGTLVEPGSGRIGRLGATGHLPLGYYKDPVKSAETFPVIDGVRYSVPGDLATVDADGSVRLLGRGSACINSAGEKIYPEEVEECLKLHPSVQDAAVVGVPDERWGETVVALVQLAHGHTLDETELIEHVRGRHARFKAPRHVLALADIGRGPNGKLDHLALRSTARSLLSTTSGA